MEEVPIAARPVHRFAQFLGEEPIEHFATSAAQVRDRLDGHTLWHVNSTAEGGGVAEMLQSILGYALDCGVPVRWLVIDGNDEFFEVTKRIHHRLHGSPGDGGPLGADERACYERTLATAADELRQRIRPGDAVILHDPQALGLAPHLAAAGARLIWSCHVGADVANEHTRAAWEFLAPYTEPTSHQVFSRRQYGWEVLDPQQLTVIPPCIDAFSAKNQPLAPEVVDAILNAAGVVPQTTTAAAEFERRDGSTGRITGRAQMIQDTPVPADARIVTQISRWDPLKDHAGVMRALAPETLQQCDAHLVLAGPDPQTVADDPEGAETFAELRRLWQALPTDVRARVHLACLPMDDLDENAAIVNALQRRSDLVVQKSLAEGFGLTVAEAMWKRRPTIGSRVGGIQDQIQSERSGLLVDPLDAPSLAAAARRLFAEPQQAAVLGEAAHQRVCTEYLAPQHLDRYFQLVSALA